MLPCAELLQRLAPWVLLDKHCNSQEVQVLFWFLVSAANLYLWRWAESLAQGAAAGFLLSEGLKTFFLKSFFRSGLQASNSSSSPQDLTHKGTEDGGKQEKDGDKERSSRRSPSCIFNFQSYLWQKPKTQAQPIYSSGRHATKYPTVHCSKKWKGKLSLKMPGMQHKSFMRRIHL